MTGLLVALLAFSAGDPDPVESFFREFAAKRDGIRTLEAQFVQTNFSVDEETTVKGRIVYVKPRRIVFRYDDPEMAHLVDGLRMYEYDADLKQVLIYELEDAPQTEALFMSFDDDTKRLREAYDVALFDPDEKDLRGLMLTPKPKESEEPLFEHARLFLRGEDLLPRRIEIQNDAESRVVIEVKDIKANAPLQAEQAQVLVPEGTTVVQDDRLLETVGPGGKLLPLPEPDARTELPPLPPTPGNAAPVTPENATQP